MRKLIEKLQGSMIECDNPNCDYNIPYIEGEKDYSLLFLNKACPKCGENLLTMEDYLQHKKLMQTVDFINRWFSWITIFQSKKVYHKRKNAIVHVHDGINISIVDEAN
jgi:ssDNA-binding Zn-finger/Zn-ribbon topoisomerase 1